MSQQPHWSQQVDYGAPSRMSLRRAFKVIIFSVGTLIVLLFLFTGSLPILGIRASPANVQGRTIAILVCLIVLVISIFLFIRSRHSMHSLRWRQYIWWLLGATLGGFLAFFLAQIFAFYFYTNDQPTVNGIALAVCFLYGISLIWIACLKPSLRQQIDESVRWILQTMPSRQISLAELIVLLQREYHCSENLLAYHIGNLNYIEQVDVPGTNIKMCCVRGSNNALAFPQIQAIQNATLRMNIERALPDLTEERVDIGLFSLGKEFETTLKAYLVAAYSKGKLTSIPGGKSPEQLSLEQMIKCVKSNGIVTDDAVLSYLRQTRNDQAHGTVPTLAERHVLMRNIHLLAGLYIDYIKFFDDLSQTLYSQPPRPDTILPPPPMGYSTSPSIVSGMPFEMFPHQKISEPHSSIPVFRVIRSIFYFLAAPIAALGVIGIFNAFFGTSTLYEGLAIFFGCGVLIGSVIIFLSLRHRTPRMRWFHFIWSLLGATAGMVMATILGYTLAANGPFSGLVLGIIFLLYGFVLAVICLW